MARFVYSMMVSLDGFVETPDHSLDWVYVDGELHRFINAQARQHEMFVNGRRLYQVLRVWDTITTDQPDLADYMVEFAEVWNTKPKLVISSKLQEVGRNARIIHTPDVDSELRLLNQQTDGELDIGGPMLAATAIRLGLMSEFRLFVQPVSIGAGTPYFPRGVRLGLRLVDAYRFASGVVYLAYQPA